LVHDLVKRSGILLEIWDAFATIAGGAAAALTGLLFVAVSIRAAAASLGALGLFAVFKTA
jgi:hypothetical protein